jgi:hypothetical protein
MDFHKPSILFAFPKKKQRFRGVTFWSIVSSVVCYNGLNRHFEALDPIASRSLLGKKTQFGCG